MYKKIGVWATAAMAAITALTAIALDLQIYFEYDGQGQMYTAEKIAAKAPILAVPALLLIVCAVMAIILKRRQVTEQEYVAEKELYEKGIYTRTAAKKDVQRTRTFRLLLLVVSVVLIVFGIVNGGMRDVLVKAINICTECIGLG